MALFFFAGVYLPWIMQIGMRIQPLPDLSRVYEVFGLLTLPQSSSAFSKAQSCYSQVSRLHFWSLNPSRKDLLSPT
jgi:hypothetical protein